MQELRAKNARNDLADLLLRSGPNAPTLCEGWQTAELAAHLWLREARPGVSLLAAVPGLRDFSERRLAETASEARSGSGYPKLVDQFRSGPPVFSPFAVPAVDRAANLLEYFIHYQDVARAVAEEPAVLAEDYREAVWRGFGRAAGALYFRGLPVGVVVRREDGPRRRFGPANKPSVVLTGELEDLVLFCSGREQAAAVEIGGDPSAIDEFHAARG
ncbi:TIGR03085 family metal-binding protein [Saxibacter everestensis]|uniref:TIGR03085 family metal-binding protein n=1 Tax=Saxibacter everestensis TaxID=2909229 RepID=A0ABY8QXM7_9MICO|nr:TIGR03085 family metal-binding protein [Brevibacteriaceae bacterium ZFBP1038]